MISIIIVNWNAGKQLRECVESIFKYGNGLVKQTIVVDNNSDDDSCEGVQGYPDVTLLHAGNNLGFGKACNLGARHAQSDYLLFLNPDAALFADTLPGVLAYMQNPQNSQAGICGVQLIGRDGEISRSCARFPSSSAFIVQALGLDRIFPRIGHFMKEWDHKENRQVDQVIGAFYFVRRSLFDSLGGFDERFFLYFEEVDFAYRAQKLGWLSMYLAEARAFHAGNGTSEKVRSHRLFYSLRSRMLYAFKHFPLYETLVVLVTTLVIEPISRLIFGVVRHSWSDTVETFAAYIMVWSWLPKWVLKRETR